MPLTASGVRELVAAFGEAPAEVKAVLKPGVLEAANVIGDQVKSNAAFSSWIPGAVKVAASFGVSSAGAKITVAERPFPHAGEVRTFEGNGVSPTPFRHPVYGNRNAWVSAVTHPFAHPALEQKRAEAVAVIATAVEGAIQSLGL